MADLQSCFFCGTPEQLKQYAVVPPRFTDDGDPQTAVLCPQCKTKLLQVIEPLVGRLEGDGSSATGSHQQESASDDGITMSSPGGAEQSGGEPEQSADDKPVETPAGGSEAPPNYRRAMRMLETREFPLDRTEVESLLANAYELETHELEAVLGHAVETGKLVEEDGQLQKPE